MKKLFYKGITLLIFSIIVSCDKDGLRPIGDRQLVPSDFNFVLLNKTEGSPLLLNVNSTVKMWYVAEGKNVIVDDIKVIPSYPGIVDSYKFYATTGLAPMLSAGKGIKTFYIEFEGKIDTLTLNVEKEDAKVERFPYKEVKYNDQIVNLNAKLPSLYVLKR